MTSLPNRASIFYSDWLKAAVALQPKTPEMRNRLAALLQLGWDEKTVESRSDEQIGVVSTEKTGAEKAGETTAKPEQKTPLESDRPKERHEVPLLQPQLTLSIPVTAWLSKWQLENVAPLPESATPRDDAIEMPMALVPRIQLWGCLTAACATERVSTRIDVDKVMARLARAELVRQMPRRLLRSHSGGVQLLLDRGLGMQTFYADQESLRHALPRWLGKDACETLTFRDDPGLGVYSPRPGLLGQKLVYRLPPPGRSILIVSDAVLGPCEYDWRVDTEWLIHIAAKARRQDSRVLLLTPLPASCRPRALRGSVVWLTWDRDLTSSRVLKCMRETKSPKQDE
ncbi:MAG: hypothetical protein NT069_24415 [Planctomycetota bacterium]|nr:hypothetical protein [Planctomycetota bacterium]